MRIEDDAATELLHLIVVCMCVYTFRAANSAESVNERFLSSHQSIEYQIQ